MSVLHCRRMHIRNVGFRSALVLVAGFALGLGAWLTPFCGAQVSVTTQRYDNFRSGLNLTETRLSPANVNVAAFGKMFTQPVDGAIVGQPLYLPNINVPGRGTHNVVYVATMHDSVYAFDADNNAGGNDQPLWHVSFTDPDNGITSVPIADQTCSKVTAFTEIGVVPAMVINAATNTLYVLAKTEENGAFVHRLHALSVSTGKEKFGGPVQITASVQYAGSTFTFQDKYQMARPGLALVNGVVYASFGSLGCKNATNASGWMMAYGAGTLQQLGVFATNPKNGYGSSIWQSGVAPAADSAGNLYITTADGPFDADSGGSHYGDTLLKLKLGSTLGLVDYFTPNNQSYLYDTDLDLGSGGVLLLPNQQGSHLHEMIAIGKEGSIYVVDRDNLGKFNPNDNSQIPQFLPFATGGVAGNALYWNGMVYVGGEEFPLQAYLTTNGQLSATPLYVSNYIFDNPAGLTLSANGNSNSILWAMNGQGAATKLFAFDALNLNQIYSTIDLPSRDGIGGAPHLVAPIVANGRVYVGGSTKLLAYGLLRTLPVQSGNNQSGPVNTALPAVLKVQATDPYGGSVAGLPVTFSATGGSFNPAVATTDGSGFASTTYTLPTAAGPVTITASSPSFVAATFSETATAGASFVIKTHTGFNQTAPVNTPLPAPISAAVKDAFNNPVPGVVVTFSDSSAGGVFSSTTVTTDSKGWADVTYTTPATPQVLYVNATVGGVSAPAKFKETVTSP